MAKSKLTACLVDDDQAIHDAIQLFAKSQGLKLVGFTSANEFLSKFQPDKVGCFVLDVRMPGMSGLELLEILHQKKTPIPVIILTGYADIPLAVRTIKNGALDVIEKPFEPDQMLATIEKAFEVYADWQQIEKIRQEVNLRLARLTPREIEVLELMAGGMKNKEIPKELGISLKTLDIHRGNLMGKMEARTLADLTQWRLLHESGLGAMPVR